jgi:hypothetical protein
MFNQRQINLQISTDAVFRKVYIGRMPESVSRVTDVDDAKHLRRRSFGKNRRKLSSLGRAGRLRKLWNHKSG